MKSNADRIEYMRHAVCNELREARKAYTLRNLPKLSDILERVNGYYRVDIISELAYNRIWDMYSLLRYGRRLRDD
jgi:hypothetical protein